MWLFQSLRIFGPINLSKHSPWDLMWMITFSERKFAEEERVLYEWISERLWNNLDKHEGKEPWSWSHITQARLYLKRSPTGSIFRLQKASLVGARNSRPATIRIALFDTEKSYLRGRIQHYHIRKFHTLSVIEKLKNTEIREYACYIWFGGVCRAYQ